MRCSASLPTASATGSEGLTFTTSRPLIFSTSEMSIRVLLPDRMPIEIGKPTIRTQLPQPDSSSIFCLHLQHGAQFERHAGRVLADAQHMFAREVVRRHGQIVWRRNTGIDPPRKVVLRSMARTE